MGCTRFADLYAKFGLDTLKISPGLLTSGNRYWKKRFRASYFNDMQETEADTRANRIDPVLRDAGWGVVDGSRVAREEIAKGRITTAGRINPLRE